MTSHSDNERHILDVKHQLNLSEGTAKFCIDAIVSHEDLQRARERIKGEHQKGKSIMEQLEAAKRITSGIVFGSGTSRLGKTVFDICRENEEKKKDQMIRKIKEDEAKYLIDVKNANLILEKKKDLNTMTIKELTIICKPLKRKTDGKMPTKKAALITKYNEWNGRPTPSFTIDHIQIEMPSTNDDTADDIESNSNDNGIGQFDTDIVNETAEI